MMSCGGPGFNTGNNYNNGSYLGEPPILIYQGNPPDNDDDVLYIKINYIPKGYDYNDIEIGCESNLIKTREKFQHTIYFVKGNDYRGSEYIRTRILPYRFKLRRNSMIHLNFPTQKLAYIDLKDTAPKNLMGNNFWPKSKVGNSSSYTWYTRATIRFKPNRPITHHCDKTTRCFISSNLIHASYYW